MGTLQRRLEAEPQADRGLPSCPSHLKGLARKAWRFWATELAAMNLDHRPDAHMLEGACMAYEEAVDAYTVIQKQGRLIAKRALDPKTNELVVVDVKKHPAVSIQNRALLVLKAFCSEFGLSPVSRGRLTVERQDETEVDLLELLSRPRAPKGADDAEIIQ